MGNTLDFASAIWQMNLLNTQVNLLTQACNRLRNCLAEACVFAERFDKEILLLASPGNVAFSLQEAGVEGPWSGEGKKQSEEGFLKTSEELIKAGKNIMKVSEAFGGLSPAGARLKVGLEVAGNMVEAFKTVMPGGDRGNITEQIVPVVSKLAVSAAAAASAEALLGPPGWVAAAKTLVTVEAISEIHSRRKKEDADDQIYRTAVKSFAMPDNQAANYMAALKHQAGRQEHTWALDATRENLKKFGPGAYQINTPVPVGVADGLCPTYNVPPAVSRIGDVKHTITKSYLEETFDLQQRLKYASMTGGRKNFDLTAIEAMRSATAYDGLHKTRKRETTDAAIQEVLFNMLDNASGGVGGKDTHNRHRRPQEVQMSERVRSVIINKPLIGHLVINATTMENGIRDLKHKVEEVLLEVLNNANAIH